MVRARETIINHARETIINQDDRKLAMHTLLTDTLGGLVCSCGQVVRDKAALQEHFALMNTPLDGAIKPSVVREKSLVARKGAIRASDPRANMRAEMERAAKAAADAAERRGRTRPRH